METNKEANKIVVYLEKDQINIYAEQYGMMEQIPIHTDGERFFVDLDKLLDMLGWKQTNRDDLMNVIWYERKRKNG